MENAIREVFGNWLEEQDDDFSGVFSVSGPGGVIYQQASGFRNMAEGLPNTATTAFGIASGTKLFTGLAVCKLIDEGKLSLEDKLSDMLPYDLGKIDERVTVYHLLTHTSGVGDYIDEEADDCEEQLRALYDKYPVQLWERLDYYLQMVAPLPPKFQPGERYGYSNSGYVLLGLVVEAVSGSPFQEYVRDAIIKPCSLGHTGFYRMDSLPADTAIGYVHDEETDKWRTNFFSMPVLGGSDGGLYTCAADMDRLWRSVFSHEVLSEEMTAAFLSAQVAIEEDGGESYGLGVYRYEDGGKLVHFAVGGDSGVGFFTAFYPGTGTVVSGLKNNGYIDEYPLIEGLLDVLG